MLSKNERTDIKIPVTFGYVNQCHDYKNFMIEICDVISIIADIKRT